MVFQTGQKVKVFLPGKNSRLFPAKATVIADTGAAKVKVAVHLVGRDTRTGKPTGNTQDVEHVITRNRVEAHNW
jgi:hypothetical protein